MSIRNLLYLEGRVAALEAFQEDLDRDDYLYNQDEDDIPEVAQSWESFALIGTDCGRRETSMHIPLKVYEKWSNKREKLRKKLKEKRDNEMKRPSSWPTGPDVMASGSVHPKTAPATINSNPDPSEELVRLRWDVTLAIKHAVKEYRKSPSIIANAWKLISNRESSSSLQPLTQP